jgi:hypothetical protein
VSISQAQRDALKRLLESETIGKAPRLRSVLKFLIDSMLEGRTEEINEQSIGQAVFGRPAGYSASDDNIVRVTVRHLRARLEQFYLTEGKDEKYLLEIPKGKYVPSLILRTPSTEGLIHVPEEPPPVIPEIKVSHAPSFSWERAAIVILLILCAALGYGLLRKAAGQQSAREQGILPLLVQDGNGILVVLADSNLQAYRQIFGKQVALDSYIDRSYEQWAPDSTDPRLLSAWRYATQTTETNVSSAIVAAAIRESAPTVPIDIKHPHEVSMRDFQSKDCILLGGPWINPWGQLFEPRLNFRLIPEELAPSQSEIHNMNPLPGEPATFTPHKEGTLNVNYARIAILPNFGKNGRVILVGATSPEALEAGGYFLVSRTSMDELSKRFSVRSPSDLPSLELVLEVKGLQSVPDSVRIIAQRNMPRPS